MKRLSFAIFLCVAFSMSAMRHSANLRMNMARISSLPDVDGKHPKKIADGALPEISPDGTRIAFNTEGDAKTRPGPNVISPLPISPAAKSQF